MRPPQWIEDVKKAAAWGVLALAAVLMLRVSVGVKDASAAIPVGAVAQLGQAEPGMAEAITAGNVAVTCANNATWNPDAGTGLVFGGSLNNPCSGGATRVVVDNDSAVAVYLAWREGTTAANYTTVGEKRCNVPATCPIGGGEFESRAAKTIGNLFCIATGATQVVSVHCHK